VNLAADWAPFPDYEQLTLRDRIALSQIITIASSKKAASLDRHRFEFHRANIMQKLGAKNRVDLERKVLGECP
jgi:DNA-binding CsgD family transcriptional regulator